MLPQPFTPHVEPATEKPSAVTEKDCCPLRPTVAPEGAITKEGAGTETVTELVSVAAQEDAVAK